MYVYLHVTHVRIQYLFARMSIYIYTGVCVCVCRWVANVIADVYADVCLCPRSCLVCLWFALFVSLCLACLCACICSSPYPKFRKVLGICRGFLNPLNSRHVASRNIYKGYPRNCLSNSFKFTLRSLRISKRKIPNTVPYFCSLRTSEHPPVPSISTLQDSRERAGDSRRPSQTSSRRSRTSSRQVSPSPSVVSLPDIDTGQLPEKAPLEALPEPTVEPLEQVEPVKPVESGMSSVFFFFILGRGWWACLFWRKRDDMG